MALAAATGAATGKDIFSEGSRGNQRGAACAAKGIRNHGNPAAGKEGPTQARNELLPGGENFSCRIHYIRGAARLILRNGIPATSAAGALCISAGLTAADTFPATYFLYLVTANKGDAASALLSRAPFSPAAINFFHFSILCCGRGKGTALVLFSCTADLASRSRT